MSATKQHVQANIPTLPSVELGKVIRDSLKLLRPDARLLVFVLVVNLLGAVLTGVGDPLALKLMIDNLERSNLRSFLILTVLMILIYSAYRGLAFVSDIQSQKLRNRLSERLVTRLVQRFYQLPYEPVATGDRGYFISRIYDEPAKVTSVVQILVDLFASGMICVGALGVCLYLSWEVTLMVSFLVPILVLLSRRYGSKIRRTSLTETEAEARLREGLGRAVESYKNVRLFDLYNAVNRHVDKLLRTYLDNRYIRYREGAAFRALSGTFLSTAETVVMIVAGLQVLQGSLTLGGLFGFVSAYWRVVNSFHSISSLVPSLASLNAHLDRVREMEERSTVGVPKGEKPLAIDWEMNDATAGYGGQPILQNLSLRWRAGERILVVGANGSGKSTLAHLIAGFLDAQGGYSRLPGMLRASAQLSPFGFIPGTLADNLEHAAASVNGEVFAKSLVERFGLATKVHHDPTTFSDGEKKKAQVIMALIKDADCYLFDEPLANVDPESKDSLMEEIFHRTANKGLFVILHGDNRYHDYFDRVIDLSATSRALVASARAALQGVKA